MQGAESFSPRRNIVYVFIFSGDNFLCCYFSGGGSITFNEFSKAFLKKDRKHSVAPERVKEVFDKVDKVRERREPYQFLYFSAPGDLVSYKPVAYKKKMCMLFKFRFSKIFTSREAIIGGNKVVRLIRLRLILISVELFSCSTHTIY